MTSEIDAYSQRLEKEVRYAYEIATRARKKGFDVTENVEIPLASDMAERIEELIQIKGLSLLIRKASESMSREEILPSFRLKL